MSKKQWILSKQDLQKFNNYRLQRYTASGIKEIDHHLFTNYYLTLMIHFMRKRKTQKDASFQNQQFLHTAVCLFKRFYLVNEHRRGEEPSQLVWVCLYLSLKQNQMAESEILQIAEQWKAKKAVNNLYNDNFKHYGCYGYTNIEKQFLKGIGFQLGVSNIIPSLQALFRKCEVSHQNLNFASILSSINMYLDKVYFDPQLLFLYSGPKLALAIMTASLQLLSENQNSMSDCTSSKDFIQYYGEQIGAVLQNNWEEISTLIQKLKTLPRFSIKQKDNEVRQIRKLFRTHRKVFQKPRSKSNQSPRLSPERNLDIPPIKAHRLQ